MSCVAIGPANPEIAGIGILVAFATQSLIAVFVSTYTTILTVVIAIGRGSDGEGERSLLQLVAAKLKMERFFKPNRQSFILKTVAELLGNGGKGGGMLTPTLKKLEFANRILIAGNDTQTFTGIALLISALSQTKTLSLYHMHILYDVISLVVSGLLKGYIRLSHITIWAGLFISYFAIFIPHLIEWDDNVPEQCYMTTKISRNEDSHPLVDKVYVGITFACTIATLRYAVIHALNHKHHNHRGVDSETNSIVVKMEQYQRAIANLLSSPNLTHETREQIKLNPRSFLRLSFQTATIDKQDSLVRIALLQSPLHIYSIFALRSANERYLEARGEEGVLRFGQVVAVVLLGTMVLTVADAVSDLVEHKSLRIGQVVEFDRIERGTWDGGG